MLFEEVEVELGLRREGVFHIAEKVDGLQSATVVGAQRYLAAGIGADSAIAAVGIAVGHRFADDGVPEQNAGLST